ncbi:tetronasin resistance protein [Staphylococcus hsinchuensis]|uniref:Tetronasin resistance protein n=1 Tax=Staphylococcus hsinchuensis TaxID=3051183 RepID=A0ABZ3EEW7_9STAP
MKERFNGSHMLLLQYLKRDWKKLLLWILCVTLFSVGFIPSFKEMSEDKALLGLYETFQNPAMISMVGPTPINSGSDYTLGALYAQEMLLFCALLALILSVLHVVGHTRKEEESGLTELVRSYQIGRQANSLAVIVEMLVVNVLIALLSTLIIVSYQMDTISVKGAIIFGITIGMAGMFGTSIALVMAQLMPTSSSANGLSLGIIGILYIIRAGTDVSNKDYSMINPLGWAYLTYPFTDNNWSPIIYNLILCILLIFIAMMLENSRDMGSSFIPERKGKAHASKFLISIPGIFFKITKGLIFWWLLTFILMGAAYGSIYGDMQDFLENNKMMQQMFASKDHSLEVSFTSTIMVVLISLVTILPMILVNKLYSEEKQLHFTQIYATHVSRSKVYWTGIITAILSGLLGIVVTTLGLGLVAQASMKHNSDLALMDFITAGYNDLPFVVLFIGITALALGWAPKFGKYAYAYLIYTFVIDYFGNLLDFPEWLEHTSVLNLLPQMPKDEFEVMPFTIIMIISIVLIVLGYIGYRRRDLIG